MTKVLDILLNDSNLQVTYTSISARRRIAENTSSDLHSGKFNSFFVHVERPLEALGALLAMSLMTKERDEMSRLKFKEHLAQMCYNYSYEGKWRVVQEVLETPTIFRNIIEVIIQKLSIRELKGNILPLLPGIVARVKVIQTDLLKEARKPKVRYPQRKRGYDDKGSLRPVHEIHSCWEHEGPNPEKEDLRTKIVSARNRHYWVPNKGGNVND